METVAKDMATGSKIQISKASVDYSMFRGHVYNDLDLGKKVRRDLVLEK